MLLKGRTQRYLRYIHLRDAFLSIADDIETVCVCGSGNGIGEIALALEFPHVHWTLTDIIAKGYPNYHIAMDRCWKWGIDNVSFSIWNVLQGTERKFDLVCSTEMLEHIADASRACRNMRKAARKYIYCLVPYATKDRNEDAVRRQDAWNRFQHFVCGFDKDSLESMLGPAAMAHGAFWMSAGTGFRLKLQAMSDLDIESRYNELIVEAEADLRRQLPTIDDYAFGIKVVCDPNTSLPKPK